MPPLGALLPRSHGPIAWDGLEAPGTGASFASGTRLAVSTQRLLAPGSSHSRGWVLAALGAITGCHGRSHRHHPGLLPALQGTATAPAPWLGLWAQLERCWRPGGSWWNQAGRGSLQQAPLSQAPTATSPGAGPATAPPSAGRCPLFPRCMGVPVPAPVPTSAGSRQEADCCRLPVLLLPPRRSGPVGAGTVPEGRRAQHAGPSEPRGVV